MLTGLFLTLAVLLERIWERPFAEITSLWTVGAMLIGLGAPAAGWLADRYGHARMMAAFYLGIGAASVAAGLVSGPSGMALALAAIGLFGAIYHPVGMGWVSMAAPLHMRGRIMGYLGIAGSIGVALAAVIAGGRISATPAHAVTPARGAPSLPVEERAPFGVLVVLAVTFTLGSVAYTAFSAALPKWLSDSLAPGAQDAAELGVLVGATGLAGSPGQLVGRRLADRPPFKWLYVATFALKLAPLLLAAMIGGPAAVLFAAVIGFTFVMMSAAPVRPKPRPPIRAGE